MPDDINSITPSDSSYSSGETTLSPEEQERIEGLNKDFLNYSNPHPNYCPYAEKFLSFVKNIPDENQLIEDFDRFNLKNKIANPDFPDKNEYTILMAACEKGYLTLTEELLNIGANIDAQNKDGYSPLMFACRNGDEELVNLLLDNNANPDLRAKSGFSAYDIAVESYNDSMIDLLKSRDLDQYSKLNDPSEVFVDLVRNGEYEEAKALLEEGSVNINHRDSEGKTATIYATINATIDTNNDKQLDFLKYLDEKGADGAIEDNLGKTATTYAAAHVQANKKVHFSDEIEYFADNPPSSNIKTGESGRISPDSVLDPSITSR